MISQEGISMFENDHNENGMENTQFDSQPVNDELSVSGVDNVTKKGKGRKAALIGGISAAVVVGGSATAYAASDTVKNQVKLRLSSPEKYYAWVTENNSKNLGQILSENYKKSIDNMEKGTDELEAGNGDNDADAASAGNAENGACATSKGTYDSPINVDVEKPEDAVCTIMFSSGTTGVSKAIMLTQGNLGAEVKNLFYHTEPGTVLFSVLPIHHAFCLSVDVLTAIKLGVNTCINDSVGHLMKNLKTFEPQVILMVPLMVETIYKKLKTVNRLIPKKLVGREVFGRRLNHIIVGGAYLDPMYVTATA